VSAKERVTQEARRNEFVKAVFGAVRKSSFDIDAHVVPATSEEVS